MGKIKVLQINTVYKNCGSTGRIVFDLKSIMVANHIESYVAYGFGYNSHDEKDIYKIINNHELFKSKLQTKLFGKHGFNNKLETFKLISWIEQISPDLIHLHNLHGHYLNIKILLQYIRQKNIPCILTMHDCWSFTGHCAYYDFAQCNKWKTGCKNCGSLLDYPKTFALFDPTAWNFKQKKILFDALNITLVTPSQWLKDEVSQSFLKDKRCIVINNGVDTKVFYPQTTDLKHRLGLSNKKIFLAMASGFSKRKGIDYLLQIPKYLLESEILILVGVSPKDKKKLSDKRIIAVEKTNNVKELAEYYSIADVFLNTTLEDNFPTTNIESLACGTPIVTFNTGGSIESVLDDEDIIIYDNKTKLTKVGAVVPQGNLESMLKVARYIYNLGKDVYSDLCVNKARVKYNKEYQYLKYITLYQEIINSNL